MITGVSDNGDGSFRAVDPEHIPATNDIDMYPAGAGSPSSRGRSRRDEYDTVDKWGMQSFPASDPPPYW
jgi:hypothetical protein